MFKKRVFILFAINHSEQKLVFMWFEKNVINIIAVTPGPLNQKVIFEAAAIISSTCQTQALGPKYDP